MINIDGQYNFWVKNKAGFSILDSLGQLAIFAAMIPVMMALFNMQTENLRKAAVAMQFKVVMKAAEQYVKANDAELRSKAGITANASPDGEITIQKLKDGKFLMDSFREYNAWGQEYAIVPRKVKGPKQYGIEDDAPNPDNLAVIVYTVGNQGYVDASRRFKNAVVPETAAIAKAGFIITDNNTKYIRGAYGAWEMTAASVGLEATAKDGHLAMMSVFDSSDLKQDFLYRYKVPGHPELNEMYADIDMRDEQSIKNVKDIDHVGTINDVAMISNVQEMKNIDVINELGSVKFDDEGACDPSDEGRMKYSSQWGMYLCRGGKVTMVGDSGNSVMIQDILMASNDQVINKPDCNNSVTGLVPEIYVMPTVYSAAKGDGSAGPEEVRPIHSVQGWGDPEGDTWRIRLKVLNSENEWVSPGANFGKVMALTACILRK